MDIDDVSGIGYYTQHLNAQKSTLKAAAARTGQLPTDRKTRGELITRQRKAAMQDMMSQFERKEGQVHSSFLPPPYLPSVESLENLTPIHIKELRLGTHHRGNYLLVRSVTAPNRMTALIVIVEDELLDALTMQLYQQPEENVQTASSIITTGRAFVVKEPFFKVMADGNYGLRIDHISDLVHIDSKHKLWPHNWKAHTDGLVKTANDWKQEGNTAMGIKNCWEAIRCYTTALACNPSPAEEPVIRLNRALAKIQDESYEDALIDTQGLGPNPNPSEKALYRAGKALYGLGRFSECADIFQTLGEKYSNNTEAAKELVRVQLRLAEQRNGAYDFKSMYKEVSRLQPPQLDHATFIGPVILKPSPGRGRGLFTTKAVKAGELLLCEKAFAHCYVGGSENGAGGTSKTSMLLNMHTNRITIGAQGELITKIVQKLWRNLRYVPEFATLHHGSYEPATVTEVDGQPVIDSFLVDRIMALNSFGCPLITKESHLAANETKNKHHSCGFWSMASRINHCCVSNVRRSFIGDLMIIRATCDISADTELGFWYKPPTGDHEEMQKALKQWGFECKCAMCLDSKNTLKKTLKKRSDLLGDLNTAFDVVNINPAKAERILHAMGQTYKNPPTDIPRLALQAPYARLAVFYSEQGKAEKVAAMVLKALESLGFVIKGAQLPSSPDEILRIEKWGIMTDDVVRLWVHLWNVYSARAPHLLQKAAEYGRLAYKICVGEDVTFEESYDGRGDLR